MAKDLNINKQNFETGVYLEEAIDLFNKEFDLIVDSVSNKNRTITITKTDIISETKLKTTTKKSVIPKIKYWEKRYEFNISERKLLLSILKKYKLNKIPSFWYGNNYTMLDLYSYVMTWGMIMECRVK